ncbi:MAG: sporulation integral membrane protein YtvI [Oscillospiraceae bacterium]|jgi:sporulation integral membrane protein YtvI
MARDKRISFLINVAFIVVILALIYIGIKYVIIWLLPFIIALAIAFMVRRPIAWLSGKTGISPKIISPIITLLFVLIILTAIIFALYQLINELGGFLSTIPDWYKAVVPGAIGKISGEIRDLTSELPEEFTEAFQDVFSDFGSYIQNGIVDLSKTALSWVADAAANLPYLLLTFIISIIAAFFMAGKTEVMKKGILRQIPDKYKLMSSELYRNFGRSVVRMARSYLIIMLITFVELLIGLAIVGVDYLVVISAIIAIVDLMPVLGTGTVLIPWGIIELIIGDTFSGVSILILYAVITIIRNIIEPRIVGSQIGLSPLITLICMYVGLKIFGLLGLFLVPIIAILLKNANDMGIIKIWKKYVPEGGTAPQDAPPGEDGKEPAQDKPGPQDGGKTRIWEKLFKGRKPSPD